MANNSLIGAVRAEATLESGKFASGAKKIRQEAKTTETQLKRSFGAMGAAAKGFGGALTAGLSVGLLAGLGKKILDYAGSIGEVAQQLGVTTKELQTFRFAAQQNGATVEQADQALGKFAITISKAQSGSKQATEAFKAVGVSLNDLKTKSKSEILGQIADQMKSTGGAAANAAAGVAIFGKGFLKIGPTLDQGSAGLNELSAAAQKLGIVLSDQQIQNADDTADKLDAVRTVLAAQIAGVVADNANSILALAQSLATLTGSIVNFLGSNPQAALGILGALAGSRFGLPGAAAGGLAGFGIGANIEENRALERSRREVPLLRHNTQKALEEIRAKRAAGQPVKQSELDRLRRLTSKLNEASGNVPTPSFGGGDLPQFLASSPKGGGKKTRTPKAPRDRSDDVTFQFDQELRRAQVDVLRAQQSMARTSEERAAIALKLLDAERAMQEAELSDRVRRAERDFAEGKITEGALEQAKLQAEKLRAEYDSVDALQRQAIAEDLAADKARDAQELSDSAYDLKLEQLQLESALAETSGARREAELRILDLMKQQEKARLEAVIADQQSSELAKQQAQQRLKELDNIYAGRAAVVKQGTRGPMESFQAQYSDIGEELEQLKVQGIEGAVNALAQFTQGWDSMRDAAISAIQQILAELIRLQLMKLALNLIGSAAGAPGLGSAAAPMFTSSNPGVGFARGGGFDVKGIQGFDKNTLSLNGLPIANVSYGERVSISNDNPTSVERPFVFNNYAPMEPHQARQTGRQAARGYHERVAFSATGKR